MDDSESEEMRVFDIDQLSENSDNQEAINYLKSVRAEAKAAPKYTNFDDSHIERKPTDKKYLVNSINKKLLADQPPIDTKWQQQIIIQFNIMKNNIIRMREWKNEVSSEVFMSSLQNYDETSEIILDQMIKQQIAFNKNVEIILPTLFLVMKIDYSAATRIVNWCSKLSLNYNSLFWIYNALSQLEEPLDADQFADLNLIQKKCLSQRNNDINLQKCSDSLTSIELQKQIAMHNCVSIDIQRLMWILMILYKQKSQLIIYFTMSLIAIKYAFSSISLFTSITVALLFIINKELRTPTFRLVLQLQLADAIFAFASIINSNSSSNSLWQHLLIQQEWLSQFQAFLINYSRESSIIWSGLFAYNMFATIVINRQGPSLYRYYIMAIGIPIIMSIYPFIPNVYGQNLVVCWFTVNEKVYCIMNYVILCIFVILSSTFFYYKTNSFLFHVTEQNSYRLFTYPIVLFMCQIWTIVDVFDWNNELDSYSAINFFSVIFSSSQGFVNSMIYGLTPQVMMILRSFFAKNHDKILAVEMLTEKQRSATMSELPTTNRVTLGRNRETFSFPSNERKEVLASIKSSQNYSIDSNRL